MGLGKLLLVSYGKENIILSQNPDITFFKKVYIKNIYISNEYLPQYFKSTPTFDRRVTVKLSKQGDMVSDITLYIELPDLPESNHSSLPSGIKKIAWVKKIAVAMIKYIDLEIGGRIISRHYSDWINIQGEFITTQEGFAIAIGNDVDIINNFTNGKQSYSLYLPLTFFFNIDKNLAFPLVSIPKQDIKIHIEFNSFNNCILEQPSHYFETDKNICLFEKGEIIRQNVDGNIALGKFVYFDVNTKRVYYEKLYNTFTIPINTNTKYKITGDNTNFSISPKINTSIYTDESYIYNNTPIIKDAYLLVNYIYLNNNEIWWFMNNTIKYIVPLVNNILEKELINLNSNYRLNLIHPTKLLIWRVMLKSNIEIKDYFNYSSYPILENEEPLVLKNKLIINSVPRCEIDNFEYYSYLQNYINTFVNSKYIYQFSFGLYPNKTDEYGSLNFSKIDDAYIQLNLNKIINSQTPFNIKAYSVYYNVFEIKDGHGAMKYSI
jgi:hypothetical protein